MISDTNVTVQGYAYILTHPGIPTVFYNHFYDWDNAIHDEIVKLVSVLISTILNEFNVFLTQAAVRLLSKHADGH